MMNGKSYIEFRVSSFLTSHLQKMEGSSSTALKWIVTGGGIAGLTCAYLLKKGGHCVTVLEKHSRYEQLANQDGGVRIPPNMTRLLQELPGAKKLLKERAMKCVGVFFYQCNAKATTQQSFVGKMDFAEEIMSRSRIPSSSISSTLCINAGVEIRHEFEVIEIISTKDDPNSYGLTVVGTCGQRITGDIVVGADGKNSVTRKVLLAEEKEEEEDSLDMNDSILPPMKEITGVTMSIPVSLMQRDPELASFLKEENYGWLFMGNGTSIALSQHGPDLYLIDLTYGMPPREDDQDDEWLSGGTPVEKVLERVKEYDPRIKKLIRLASTSHWCIQTVYNLPRHISKLGELVLIGDAAHSIYFEEAFTLGRLFSVPSCNFKENASFLLNEYQQIHQKRTRALEVNGMDTVVLLGLLPGPEREGRNNGFRLTLDLEGADDATLEQVWAGYIAQFNYDARDAVDEWCMNCVSVANLDVSITTAKSSHRSFFHKLSLR
ncbi:FAD/NAD(P)-binding domain-containing protein [Gymnopus androsaceus JB14]|uniref:FAD/NAD(P)-binding domain-containing protein n=1 Tax=Gymnopus androsaceus JB14 TaxID=1447944 RepID=A0A6A4IHI4_9AGAR|nr:FAD/NAD(P)-binding domain-containing protein [Gymnopus androsaceus JB14]